MTEIKRVNSDDKDFIELVKHLDSDLAEKDGRDHLFYNQFNKIDKIKYGVVSYENGKPVGCGAIKEFNSDVSNSIVHSTKVSFSSGIKTIAAM